MTDITDSDAPATMLAAQLSESGSIGNLRIVELPMPVPPDGWVRLKVMAFGLNRSEYHSVHGLAEGMTFPRILGIEASGVIDLDPEGGVWWWMHRSWEGCCVSGTGFGWGVRRDAVARVVAGESASAVARVLGYRRGTVSRWC